MTMYAALLYGLALMAQAAPAAGGTLVTLSCQLPARPAEGAGGKPAPRIFQIGSGSLREWNEVTHEYGANLCRSFNCVKAADRSEGSISSASVTYVVGVQNGGAEGYWRATGATGGGVTHGACQIVPAPAPRRP
jgi:hypothetical protein